MTLGPVRSLGLIEAAALLRIHPHTLRERARAGLGANGTWVQGWLYVHNDEVKESGT